MTSSDTAKIVLVAATDRHHNGIAHELFIRDIFKAKQNWRILAVRGSRYFTPALLRDADLLIVSHGPEPDPLDLYTDPAGRSEQVHPGAAFWTPPNVNAILDAVRNRGMGFLALHETALCGNEAMYDLLDIRPAATYSPQPLWVRNFAHEHPVTMGAGKFFIPLDEQGAVILRSPSTTTFFETTAIHDKRQAIGGWCREEGKGRVVGLLPGHSAEAYETPEYRNILWRAAHWAMRREIPDYPEAGNTLYE
jgi:hypothetical protein